MPSPVGVGITEPMQLAACAGAQRRHSSHALVDEQ
jgi:hypothetical protein